MNKKLLFGVFLSLLVAEASAQHQTIGGYNVYYGDLHNHSEVSDGTGTPATAYNYAKYTAHLDFFGLSDHSGSISSTEWTDIKNQANTFNQDGVFTAFYGFEWTSSGAYGHVAVINTDDYCSTSSPTNTFEGLVTWLASRPDGIAFFNHPGREDNSGLEFNHFTTAPSNQFVGMELWNKGDGFNIYYYNDGYYTGDNNKSYFDEANNRSWRAGASGAGDNHVGTWGNAYPYRMAILSNNLSRAALLAAMQARRFFSTLDKNLSLSFKINGMEMGSSMIGGNYTAQIQAADADGEIFNQVILYNKNHDIVNMWSLSTGTVNVSINLITLHDDYYYVKVKQADGDEAISSPIWISGVTSNRYPACSIKSPSNGAIFTAPADIAINADASDSDGSISKVEFYQGTSKLGEDLVSPYNFIWNNVSTGSYSLTARAIDNSGATITSSAVSFDVIARPIRVTADSRVKVYGESDPELTYRITSGSLAGTDSFSGALTRDAGEDAGTYTIRQGTLALNSNYTITFAEANLTIAVRPITVTADSSVKLYGESDPELTYGITSGSLAGTDIFSGALTRDAGEDVGSYTISQGTLALNSNYAITFAAANLTIAARPITVTAYSMTKVFGESDPELTFVITSGSLTGTDAFSGALTRDVGEDAGSYTISQGTLALNSNYIITYVEAILTIAARPITVTANSITKFYGETDPELTYVITSGSLVGTDTFSGALTRNAGEDVGTYSIMQGTLALNKNYTVTYAEASLTINAMPITVTAKSRVKVYGESDPELTFGITSGSLVGTDTFSGALIRDAGEDVGTYTISQGTLALSSNYDLTFRGADFKITAHFEMKAYPNPFTDHISFELDLNKNANISIDIFNLIGIKIATVFSGDAEADFYHFDYEPEHITNGLLIYQLTIEGQVIVTGKAIRKE